MAKKLNIALLSGGISSEREVSIKSGDQIFKALDKTKYEVTRYDPKFDIPKIVQDAKKIDVALIILHGPFGEDGTVQGLLDLLNIPYQCSGVLSSAIAMDKVCSKILYKNAGLNIPKDVVIQKKELLDIEKKTEHLNFPVVVKPIAGGSSIGITKVNEHKNLKNAIKEAFKYDKRIMVEEYIEGRELTVGILGNDNLEALPVIEIIPDKKFTFFDFEAKYTPGATKEVCPAEIDDAITKKAQDCGKKAHLALSCSGYSRTDMILKDNELYMLETNTIPGMTETSLLPQAAKEAGYTFSDLLNELIRLALEKK